MTGNYEVIEVTKENEQQYLKGIVELEELVLDKMEKSGKIGQLFITSENDIKDYIESNSNHVMVAINNSDKSIISTAYITQGQQDFSYNDITKYVKSGEDYTKFVRSKYSKNEYEHNLRKTYIDKITAFVYARDMILKENNIDKLDEMTEEQKNAIFMEFVENERKDTKNGFQELSKIRESLNKNMAAYMKFVKKNIEGYRDFYWADFEFLKKNCEHNKPEDIEKKSNNLFGKIFKILKENDSEENSEKQICTYDSTMETYDKIMSYQKYNIKDMSHCQNKSKYFNANTSNTIELDTYITHPNNRENGIARIVVLNGLKKSLNQVLKNEKNSEIFIASTLHQDNLSSKYVSEFFGLTDYIFVNRRTGRDRQVHLFGMKKEDVPEYLRKMEKKIAVLYGYNPSKIDINDNEKLKIINEQLNYEINELQRLNEIKNLEKHQKFSGYIKVKKSKIEQLKEMKNSIKIEKENISLRGL